MNEKLTGCVYDKKAIARSVAKMLIEIDAVLFNVNEPFKLTSGMVSPVYIDCRKIISFPECGKWHGLCATVILNDIGYESLMCLPEVKQLESLFARLAERTHLPRNMFERN